VLSVGRGVDLGIIVGWSEGLNFFSHTLSHTLEHSAASRKNNVFEKVLLDITVTFHDGVVGELMDTVQVFLSTFWCEEDLGALQAHAVNSDGLGTWELITLGDVGALVLGSLEFSIEIVSNLSVHVLNLNSNIISLSALLGRVDR